MDHQERCTLLEDEVARLAGAMAAVGLATPVPSCPGWTVADLGLHLGTVHRWAEGLVRTRAQRRIGSSGDVLDEGPPGPEWIREGGAALLATLRAADPDAPMWAWGPDRHVRFWSRRMLHETLVHRMDVELAGGCEPRVASPVAADAIDELLVNLPSAAHFSPGVRDLRGDGQRLSVRPNAGEPHVGCGRSRGNVLGPGGPGPFSLGRG